MRKRFHYILFLLGIAFCSFGSAAYAETVSQEFADANRAYSRGDYDEAIAGYERIQRTEGLNSSVFFNLGNAYFQKGELGKSILNYERALELSPNDPDVLANLHTARDALGIEVPEPRWWQSLLSSMTPGAWAYLASASFLLFVGLVFVYWFRPQTLSAIGLNTRNQLRLWRFALFAMFLVVAGTFACAAMSLPKRNYAVVTVEEAPVLQSPFEKAKEVSSLSEGETVMVDKIDKAYGDFVRVRYGKRALGWVSRKDVDAIDPYLW